MLQHSNFTIIQKSLKIYHIIITNVPKPICSSLITLLRKFLYQLTPGSRPISISINGITHEYTHLNGINQDALEFIINLKSITFLLTKCTEIQITTKCTNTTTTLSTDLNIPQLCSALPPIITIANFQYPIIFYYTISIKKNILSFSHIDSYFQYPKDSTQIYLTGTFSPIQKITHKIVTTTHNNTLLFSVKSNAIPSKLTLLSTLVLPLSNFLNLTSNIIGTLSLSYCPCLLTATLSTSLSSLFGTSVIQYYLSLKNLYYLKDIITIKGTSIKLLYRIKSKYLHIVRKFFHIISLTS